MSTRVLFVGGGSIGHIAPSVAVLKELQVIDPDTTAHFVCANREDETKFLTENNLPFSTIRAPRLSVSFLWKFWIAVKECSTILDAQRPDVLFSKGGYVSVPMCFAAYRKKIPIIQHESDAVSGRANMIVSWWSKKVCVGFKDTSIQNTPTVFTGNPVRPEVLTGSKEQGYSITGFTGNRPIVLVIGGSQGAMAINEIIEAKLKQLTSVVDIIHITGRGKQTNIPAETKGYYSIEFAEEQLPHLYAIATMAISRAGAGSIGELAACSIPAVFVPLRGVGHDHQQSNAEHALATGGCIVVQQINLPDYLISSIDEICSESELREKMSKAMHTMYTPDAARRIASAIAECLASDTRKP